MLLVLPSPRLDEPSSMRFCPRWTRLSRPSAVQLACCDGMLPSSNLGCQVTGTTVLLGLGLFTKQLSHSTMCPRIFTTERLTAMQAPTREASPGLLNDATFTLVAFSTSLLHDPTAKVPHAVNT